MQVGVSSDLRERGQCWGSRDLSDGLVSEGRARRMRQLPRVCRGARKLPRGCSGRWQGVDDCAPVHSRAHAEIGGKLVLLPGNGRLLRATRQHSPAPMPSRSVVHRTCGDKHAGHDAEVPSPRAIVRGQSRWQRGQLHPRPYLKDLSRGTFCVAADLFVREIAPAHIGHARVRVRQDCGKESHEPLPNEDSQAGLGLRRGDTVSRTARTDPHISRGLRNRSIARQGRAGSNRSIPPRVKSRAGRDPQIARTFRATSAVPPERKALRQIADRGHFRVAAGGPGRTSSISCVPLQARDWPRNGPPPTPDYARNVISLWLTAILGDLLGCTGLLVWSFFFAAILVSSSSQLSLEKPPSSNRDRNPLFWVPTYKIENDKQKTTGRQEYLAIAARP
jgi:hypothetical protein